MLGVVEVACERQYSVINQYNHNRTRRPLQEGAVPTQGSVCPGKHERTSQLAVSVCWHRLLWYKVWQK